MQIIIKHKIINTYLFMNLFHPLKWILQMKLTEFFPVQNSVQIHPTILSIVGWNKLIIENT